MKLWKILLIVAALVGGGWLVKYVTTPLPGKEMPDQGREHVSEQEVAEFTYNSNPPVSGPHLPDWVRPGVYDAPQSKGLLIHSLEHGYVIINYNCNATGVTGGIIKQVYAQEASPAAEPEATGSAVNETDACKTLVKQLEDIARNKALKKLIVVPNPQLTAKIALTAWRYIDTMNDLNQARIERFIDFHRDHGPEQTME